MADDKTTDDDLWLEFMGGSLTDGGRETFSKVLAKVRSAAVRRVAPDRETLARVSWTYSDGTVHMLSSEAIAALLASGVLGVPADRESVTIPRDLYSELCARRADQRTADRETIARALLKSRLGFLASQANDETRNEVLRDADAVLAVLVPADQVRAETLREAHSIISKRRGTYEAGIDLMERVAELEAGLGA